MKTPSRTLRIGVAVLALVLGVAFAAPSALVRSDTSTVLTDTALASRSIARFERRMREDPWNYIVAGRLVDRYLLRFQMGADLVDLRRAERVVRQVLPVVSNRATGYARLSFVLLSQHKFAEAFDAAREALAADSLDESALATTFDAALATGRYETAAAALARLPQGKLSYRFRRAHWYAAQGEVQNAYYTMARGCREIERASLRPQMLAWCLTELAKLEKTRTGADSTALLLKRALKAEPAYRGAIEGLADLAHERGDWTHAIELYRRVATDAHPDIYLRLAEAYGAIGDSAAARANEQRFLTIATRPESEVLYAHPLAVYYAERPAMRDSALAIILRDEARRPAVETDDVLAWVRFQRHELPEALAASDRALRWGSPSPTMDYHRARILAALGRDQEAADLLQRALARPELLEPHARRDAREHGYASTASVAGSALS